MPLTLDEMAETKKSLPPNDRLGNFVLIDKQRLSKELADFKAGVKTKEEVEVVADVLFERLRRANMRVK